MAAFIHIGAAKCGSSAIQTYFSQFPEGPCIDGETYTYCCLAKGKVLMPRMVAASARQCILGYVNSSISETLSIDEIRRMKDETSVLDGKLIVSQERWMCDLKDQEMRGQILEIVRGDRGRQLHLVGFVRPPVKWINSAWWQWGVWDGAIDKDEWIDDMIKRARWSEYFDIYQRDSGISRVTLMPIRKNVVDQFAEVAMISRRAEMDRKANTALPAEVLEMLLKSKRIRCDPHDSFPDFVSLRALGNSPFCYTPAPWGLTMSQVKRIIDETRDSILSLMPNLSACDQACVAADPSWWDADYYSHHFQERQELADIEQFDDKISRIQNLSEDLLVKLIDAMKLLGRNGLLDKLP